MNIRFAYYQMRALLQTLPQREHFWQKSYLAVDAALLLRRCLRLTYALLQPMRPLNVSGKTCAVILLSHNRPHNMSLIATSALRNDFVRRVVVSNSNRAVRIQEWIDINDPRLVLIDETEATGPGHRFFLSSQESGSYFLSVDDDIFLTPEQWGRLFERLVKDDSVAHGIKGNLYEPRLGSPGFNVCNVFGTEQDVDVLVGAFAFTRDHLSRLFSLGHALGIENISDLRNGEDILLSLAGTGRPKIHRVGRIMECASNSLARVALSKTIDNFMEERSRLFERAREARRAMKPEWEPDRSLRHV
jgi:hypothetical protein